LGPHENLEENFGQNRHQRRGTRGQESRQEAFDITDGWRQPLNAAYRVRWQNIRTRASSVNFGQTLDTLAIENYIFSQTDG
jgi:hypothetical protein